MDKLFSPKSSISLLAGAVTTLVVHTYNWVMIHHYGTDHTNMTIDVAQSIQTIVTWVLVMISPQSANVNLNGSIAK